MALNFPSSPSVNSTYTFNGKTWTYTGNAWALSYGTLNTGTVPEGSNLYFTNARATAAVTNASLSNITVSGNATVSGNFGIGTSSPSLKLDVNGSIKMSGGNGTALTWDTTISSQYLKYDSTLDGLIAAGYGGLAWRVSGSSSNAMLLDASGNLGIGTTSPAYKLDVNGNFRLANFASGSTSGYFGCADTGSITLNFGGTTTPAKGRILYSDNSDLFAFYTNSTERMRLDSTGNLGLGTSTLYPSAAHPSASQIRVGLTGNFFAQNSAGLGIAGTSLLDNAYIRNSTGDFAYITSAKASRVILLNGNVYFQRSTGNDTADGVVGFNTSVFIGETGNLGIGTTNPSSKFEVQFTTNDYGFFSNTGDNNTGIRIQNTGRAYGIFVDGGAGASNGLRFYDFTAGAERARIDSSGNLGIGTASPAAKLDVNQAATSFPGFRIYGNSSPGMQLYETSGVTAHFVNDSAGVYLGSTTSHPLVLRTANTERARIDSSGNLGIGTSSPSSNLQVVKSTAQTDIDSSTQVLLLENTATDTSGNLTGIRFRQTNGTNAGQTFIGMSSTGDSATRARLVFAPPNTSGNSTERMTIMSSGNVGIGTASPTVKFQTVQTIDDWTGDFKNYTANAYGLRVDLSGSSGTNAALQVYTASGNGMKVQNNGLVGIGTFAPASTLHVAGGTIRNSGTNGVLQLLDGNTSGGVKIAAYNTAVNANGYLAFEGYSIEYGRFSATGGFSVGTTADPGAGAIYATGNITAYYSDKRLKIVSGKIQNALDKVSKLSGVYYKNNDVAKSYGYTGDETQVGVLAQDVESVLPEVVKAAPFDLDENGNSKSGEDYKTVQYEKLVPLLIEAINELQAKVKALEAR